MTTSKSKLSNVETLRTLADRADSIRKVMPKDFASWSLQDKILFVATSGVRTALQEIQELADRVAKDGPISAIRWGNRAVEAEERLTWSWRLVDIFAYDNCLTPEQVRNEFANVLSELNSKVRQSSLASYTSHFANAVEMAQREAWIHMLDVLERECK